MALIPPDAAVRLRMETDASLSPIAPLKGISSDLPDLQAGQRFFARIQQPLPENTYRALVGSREITLSLPETVKTGETLELIVVERNSRMVLAQLADGGANPANIASADAHEIANTTRISPAGQLIGKLLAPAGEEPAPVILNRGAPLVTAPLPQAAALAATLAPKLAQAAAQSGLFYEAHQALWLSGQHSVEALKEEPQAHHAALQAAPKPVAADVAGRAGALADPQEAAAAAVSLSSPDTATTVAVKDLMQAIPAELRPLVQQQLDAAATQRMTWHGEVWPGQTMQWQISREASDPSSSAGNNDDGDHWNTSLTMTTPKLGRIEARLGIAGSRVRLSLAADSATSVSKLSQRLSALASALEAAGLNPAGLQVTRNGSR